MFLNVLYLGNFYLSHTLAPRVACTSGACIAGLGLAQSAFLWLLVRTAVWRVGRWSWRGPDIVPANLKA